MLAIDRLVLAAAAAAEPLKGELAALGLLERGGRRVFDMFTIGMLGMTEKSIVGGSSVVGGLRVAAGDRDNAAINRYRAGIPH